MTKLRTIQILRGTTAQNNAYTGVIGELTMDTEKKQLRIHDGSTAGGKVVGGDGITNQNPASGATNPIYDWVGTLAEYNAQSVATNHPDWVCYITDDLTSGAYDAYSKSQTDALLANKVSTGHEIIEFQTPNAGNNYTWYRKYADGWVEQGGCVPTVNDGVWTITLPVAMADAHYTSVITREYTNYSGTGTDIAYDAVWAKTSTNFKCWEKWTGSIALNWQVSGMAA